MAPSSMPGNKGKYPFIVLLMATCFAAGYQAHHHHLFPLKRFVERHFSDTEIPIPHYRNIADRKEIPCPLSDDTKTLVIFGQSNSANHVGMRHVDDSGRIANYFSGKCYAAKDPLLGATGGGEGLEYLWHQNS